jgi:hypothetical protein
MNTLEPYENSKGKYDDAGTKRRMVRIYKVCGGQWNSKLATKLKPKGRSVLKRQGKMEKSPEDTTGFLD